MTRQDVHALLAEIDQVAGWCHHDPAVLSVRRWDGRVRYILDVELAETALGNQEVALVSQEVAARFAKVACRTECDTREVTDHDLVWTGYLKHADAKFLTASLPRHTLEGFLVHLSASPAHP